MFRYPRSVRERAAVAEIAHIKDARTAIMFSVAALFSDLLQQPDTRVSIFGVSIDIHDAFLVSGTFCGLALAYGFFSLSYAIELTVFGPGHFQRMLLRRLLCFARNKVFAKKNWEYNIKLAKLTVTILYSMIFLIIGIGAAILFGVYALGIIVSFSDLINLVEFSFNKVFGLS